MKRKNIILILMTFILFFSNLVVEGSKLGDLNTYNYDWDEKMVISGEEQLFKAFYVPENMDAVNLNLSLKLKPSPTLIKELSSITVLMNNIKVNSTTIEQLNSNGILKINIPKELVYKGGNTIAIKGFLKSSWEDCEINSDINWLLVEESSYFTFDYYRRNSVYIRDIFDSTYYSDGVQGKVNIVLPNDLNQVNYSQTATLGALIGFVHRGREVDNVLDTYRYSDLEKLNRESIIIGTADQIRNLDEDLFTDKEWKYVEENGYIALRKVGNKNHFLLISSTEEQLEILTRVLGNKSLLEQIKDKDYILNKNKLIAENDFNENPNLNELGYENTNQIGNGEKVFNYYFSIPGNKTLGKDNKFTFVYNYSPLKLEDRGYVIVAINGENLLTKDLSVDKQEDKIEFSIPERYFQYTGFNISLKINLNPKSLGCLSKTYDNIWLGIHGDSSNFQLDLRERNKYSLLSSHGFMQNTQGRVDNSIYIDDFKNIDIGSIVEVSSYLGKVSQGVNKLLVSKSKEDVNSSGFLFGLNSSSIIKDMNEDLRIPTFEEEFYSKDLFIQNTPSLAGIQIAQKDNKLVILANDRTQLNNGIQIYPLSISGKDAVIIKDKEVIAFFGEDLDGESKEARGINIDYEILIALMVLLAAVVLIFVLYERI